MSGARLKPLEVLGAVVLGVVTGVYIFDPAAKEFAAKYGNKGSPNAAVPQDRKGPEQQ